LYCGCDRAGQLGERGSLGREGLERVVAILRFQASSPHLCRLRTGPFGPDGKLSFVLTACQVFCGAQ
jgi:hypothetical protein